MHNRDGNRVEECREFAADFKINGQAIDINKIAAVHCLVMGGGMYTHNFTQASLTKVNGLQNTLENIHTERDEVHFGISRVEFIARYTNSVRYLACLQHCHRHT